MRIDERYYRRVFHTQHRELHEAVVDYLSYFLHRRKTLDAETTVEQIQEIATAVRQAMSTSCICTVGSKEAIQKEKDRFDRVFEVL